MKCAEARPLFSSYLDRAVTGAEMHEISSHLEGCEGCRSEYTTLERSRAMLAALGRKQAPTDLARKIKIAVASERSRTWQTIMSGYSVRFRNALDAFMVPATAGVLSAILFFAALIGFFPVHAVGADDVPTMLYVPPRLEMSVADTELDIDSPVVVEAYIGVNGRVEAYRVLSGPDDSQVHMQLNRALLFTIFAPAQSFGRSVFGKAVMTFFYIRVRG